MIPLSYGLALIAISFLQLQLLLSILRHMVIRGPSEILHFSFWRERAGHWEELILLEEGMEVTSPEKGAVGTE